MTKEELQERIEELENDVDYWENEYDNLDDKCRELESKCDELESQISDSIHTEHFIKRLKIENLYTPVMESFIDEFMRYHNENT